MPDLNTIHQVVPFRQALHFVFSLYSCHVAHNHNQNIHRTIKSWERKGWLLKRKQNMHNILCRLLSSHIIAHNSQLPSMARHDHTIFFFFCVLASIF